MRRRCLKSRARWVTCRRSSGRWAATLRPCRARRGSCAITCAPVPMIPFQALVALLIVSTAKSSAHEPRPSLVIVLIHLSRLWQHCRCIATTIVARSRLLYWVPSFLASLSTFLRMCKGVILVVCLNMSFWSLVSCICRRIYSQCRMCHGSLVCVVLR